MLGNISYFCCRLLTFFSKLTFSKNSFRNTIRVSTVWIQIRTNILLVLIRGQTVCKGYQQTTKVAASKERVYPYPAIYQNCHLHSHLPMYFGRPLSKQNGTRSDCSFWRSLIRAHSVAMINLVCSACMGSKCKKQMKYSG